MEKTISLADLVRNAARIAEEIETEGTVFRVIRGGRGSMVLVDESYFDSWMATLDEMRRPAWQEALAQARREVAAKRGRSLDLIAKELGLSRGSRSEAGKQNARRAGAR